LNGLELSRLFFEEAVAPLAERRLPGVRYTAGLLGDCSDVIGFDDAISRDHGWGPRCQLLLDAEHHAALLAALASELPPRFRGYPTSYANLQMVEVAGPPIRHWVGVATPERFLRDELGIAGVAGLGLDDWLALRSWKLLGVTAGALFRDDLDFAAARRALAAYPDDVRVYLLAAEWVKILDEQAFPGRAGSRGDEAGAAILSARLAECLMRMGFHLERRYAPYSKWFGSGFARLPRCAAIGEAIARMVVAPDWEARDRAWSEALAATLALHVEEGLLAPDKYRPAPVYVGRPGTGLPQFERGGPPSIESLLEELVGHIVDPEIRRRAAGLPRA